MATIIAPSDPVITGTADADLIFQGTTDTTPVTINAGGGNDVAIGNHGSVFLAAGGHASVETAAAIDDAGFWSLANNALVADDATPSTAVAGTGDGALAYIAVTVGAGETITADMDFAFGGIGGPSWDSRIELIGSDGTSVLANGDDSSVTDGGIGSLEFGAGATRDSYVTYTNASASAVTLYVAVGAYSSSSDDPVGIPEGNAYLVNISVTGHANTGAFLTEDVTLNGESGDDYLIGNAGADTIDGGTGNDIIYGGAGADALNGGDDDDTIFAGTGVGDATNDIVHGDGGNDVIHSSGDGSYFGEIGNDTIVAGDTSVFETLDGGDGVDTLDLSAAGAVGQFAYTYNLATEAGSFDDFEHFTGFENVITGDLGDDIIGSAVANVITVNGGDDTVDAADGNDIVLGGTGTNTLNGGGDFDYASYADAASGVTVSLALQGTQQDTGVSSDTLSNFEGLIGSAFDDVLTGDDFDNRFIGGTGDDTIDGGDGEDTLDLTAAANGWFIDLRDGTGADNAGNSAALSGIEIVLGSALGDTLIANDGAPGLYGLGGDDIIVAGNGAGRPLDGGIGVDTIDLSSLDSFNQLYTIDLKAGTTDLNDVILNFENLISGNTADHVTGTRGDNVITTNDGDDEVHAGGGDDTIVAGRGNDILDGGRGADMMTGGIGDDSYFVDNASDRVIEGRRGGEDIVRSRIDYNLGANVEDLSLSGRARVGVGNGFDNRITGSDGADTLSGAGGNDTMLGGRGGDAIDGGTGNDTLIGGVGQDTLTGGRGHDIFRFATGDTGRTAGAADTITDFSHRDGDTINLAAVDAVAGTTASEPFRFIGASAFTGVAGQLRYAFSGGDTLVMGDTDGNGRADVFIRLSGHVALTLDDFAGVRAANAPIGGDAVVAHDLVI